MRDFLRELNAGGVDIVVAAHVRRRPFLHPDAILTPR
jgi:hypothetical protein